MTLLVLLATVSLSFASGPTHSGATGTPVESPVPGELALDSAPAMATTGATPSSTPVEKITPEQAKSLMVEFSRALRSEVKALEHRQSFEIKELKSSQGAREKEFKAREKIARREFFKTAVKGNEKRAWIQERKKRYEALLSLMKDEVVQRKKEHEVRKKSLVDEQAERLKEFKAVLDRGERPAQSLWPRS